MAFNRAILRISVKSANKLYKNYVMNHSTLKLTKCYQAAFDSSLMEMFIKLLKINPKPKKISRSIYLTWLAIQLLENMGNKFPSQKEIDATELILKRYTNRKILKDIYKCACLNISDASQARSIA